VVRRVASRATWRAGWNASWCSQTLSAAGSPRVRAVGIDQCWPWYLRAPRVSGLADDSGATKYFVERVRAVGGSCLSARELESHWFVEGRPGRLQRQEVCKSQTERGVVWLNNTKNRTDLFILGPFSGSTTSCFRWTLHGSGSFFASHSFPSVGASVAGNRD
jgi:hypothetical protein